MKGLILLPLALLIAGCEHPPGPNEAAVHVQASYDFRAGCIVVEAHDKDAPDKSQSQRIVVKGRTPPSKVDIAVYRAADWGRSVELTVTAHEQKCEGPEVAREVREYTLKKAGVETLEVSLHAQDVDGDGYMAASSGGTDCDDSDGRRAPGNSEVCDEVDNDCNNVVDEGLAVSPFYRDADGDGFGAESDMVQKCRAPAGYVAAINVFDCNDGDGAVKPGATELCNGVDDNCAGGIDETFPQKESSCSANGCSGRYSCNDAHDGVVCDAPMPIGYYPDADNDGEGSASASAENVCPPAAAPAGKVANNTDCDDNDPYNKSTGTEVCDDRDNNCANGKSDETTVCGGKGWKELTSPTVPTSRNWNTVAVGAGGSPVWIAGASGALAVRTSSSTGAFTEFHQKCGTNNWNAAWVRPSDGSVFLAGDGGNLAAYDGVASSCTTASTTNASGGITSSHNLTSIVGFESSGVTTIYAVNDYGYFFTWTPGSVPAFKYYRTSFQPYLDIHGVERSRLFLAAVDSYGGDYANIHTYNVDTDTLNYTPTFSGLPIANDATVRGVWAWDSTHAYAVGKAGLFLSWTGNNDWSFISPNASMQVDLNSVVALDSFSTYIASQDGKIRRPGTSDWLVHFTASGALKDIAASSRQNIWAVGDGIVVHFPE